jgi:hypothetical protein
MDQSALSVKLNNRIKVVQITHDLYEKNIPPCCAFKTMEEHQDIGLCWGLSSRIQQGRSVYGLCDDCIENEQSPYRINSLGG